MKVDTGLATTLNTALTHWPHFWLVIAESFGQYVARKAKGAMHKVAVKLIKRLLRVYDCCDHRWSTSLTLVLGR